MAETGFEVVYLADRLDGPDDLRSVRGLVERVELRGHLTRVICRSAAADHGIEGLIERPGLGRRWLIPWLSRGLMLDEVPGRPRILHVLGMSMAEAGLDIAERWKLPYLLTVDEFPARGERLRVSRSWCRGLVSTNRELGEALGRDYSIPADWIHEVPRGLPEPFGDAGRPRAGRVPVIGAAGPLVPSSGLGVFLYAARKVVDSGIDAEFLIAGEGDDEADLRRKAERLRIADRLTFADEMTVGLTFWDALDIYCQTSVAPTTGRPLGLAMAHGVPSVASDVEGLRSWFQDGSSGVRVPSGDASALARAIADLLAHPDRAERLGRAGQLATSVDHHPDREAEQLLDLYQKVTAAGPEPAAFAATRPGEPGRSRAGPRGFSASGLSAWPSPFNPAS